MDSTIEEEEDDREVWGRGRSMSVSLPLAVAALIALLLAVAGCGESGAAAQNPAPTSGGDEVVVDMIGSEFEPETVTVPVGATITWVNRDAVSHNAVADNGSWKTEIFSEGESATLTFDTPGTFPYVCTLHPSMVGTVIVQ